MTFSRIIAFQGIHNFRDYGGYAAAGGRLREGVLFRSGQHGDATSGDLAEIDALDIRTVVDLRGDTERRLWPCKRSPGFAGEVHFHDGETAGAGGAAHAVAARDVVTPEDARRAMIDLYAFMPERPNLQGALRLYFAALADKPEASMVHCYAGKDRTGFAVALLHRLLGVHADDTMADYLLTNIAGDRAARIAAGAASIRRTRPNASDAAIEVLMGVEPDFLDAAFATVEAKWGGVERYTEDVLGVDATMRRRLANALIT